MKYFYVLFILFAFSCGEDKHTKDIEENTYYSKYMEIYNAYDSIGPEKTITDLDEYISEFPNAQNAYVFKAWVLANNNQLNKIDAVLEEALKYDTTNIAIYEYWAAFLLRDSLRFEDAKAINEKGLQLDLNHLGLENNDSWILLFENNKEKSLENAIKVIAADTLNSSRYFRTAAVCASANEMDSLFSYYNNMSIKYGQTDSFELETFRKGEETILELYQKLK